MPLKELYEYVSLLC